MPALTRSSRRNMRRTLPLRRSGDSREMLMQPKAMSQAFRATRVRVNVGFGGQPRDHKPGASFVVDGSIWVHSALRCSRTCAPSVPFFAIAQLPAARTARVETSPLGWFKTPSCRTARAPLRSPENVKRFFSDAAGESHTERVTPPFEPSVSARPLLQGHGLTHSVFSGRNMNAKRRAGPIAARKASVAGPDQRGTCVSTEEIML